MRKCMYGSAEMYVWKCGNVNILWLLLKPKLNSLNLYYEQIENLQRSQLIPRLIEYSARTK